jgi:phage gp29-like protein
LGSVSSLKAIQRRPVLSEIMTAENDITRNYIGRILLNPDKVLSSESRGKGIEIYEDMLYEARVFSEMQKRKLAVIGKEWDIEPASDNAQDVKVAEFVKEVFKKFSYDTARQSLLSGIVTGFKPAEIMWDYSEGDIWIKSLNGGSPRRFAFDLRGNLRLLTWGNMIEGEELPDRKFIVFRNPSDSNSPYGDGLGRPLYWPVWFKKNGVKFWAVFLDKFGQPTPWGKYPPGTNPEAQQKFIDALKAMQTDQAIITPDNMAVELLEAARASSVDSYEKWEKFWNDAITFIILGQTATTEGTPGKLGAETERADIRREIVKADADLLSECQNNFLIPWLCDYNFPGLKAYPKVWVRTEPEKDLKALAERDRIIIKEIGLPTPVSYLRDTYGIPAPQPGEEVIQIPQSSLFQF